MFQILHPFPYSKRFEVAKGDEYIHLLRLKQIYLIAARNEVYLRWPENFDSDDIYELIDYELHFQVGWTIELERLKSQFTPEERLELPMPTRPFTESGIQAFTQVHRTLFHGKSLFEKIKHKLSGLIEDNHLVDLNFIQAQKAIDLPDAMMKHQLEKLRMNMVWVPYGDSMLSQALLLPFRKFQKDFMVSTTPITQHQFNFVMHYNPSEHVGMEFQNHPVVNVSWLNAIRFCNELSFMVGRNPFYIFDGHNIVENPKSSGFCLLNREQWRFAAMGGSRNPFAGHEQVDDAAWFFENTYSHTAAVAQKSPNNFGLYDMCGNVCEWTSTLSAVEEPTNKAFEINVKYRVACGGSWVDQVENVTSHSFSEFKEVYKASHIGFRVMLNS